MLTIAPWLPAAMICIPQSSAAPTSSSQSRPDRAGQPDNRAHGKKPRKKIHLSFSPSLGAIIIPNEPVEASFGIGVRATAGVTLSSLFLLELEGGWTGFVVMDSSTEWRPDIWIASASLAVRWYPNGAQLTRVVNPFLIAGAGYHHLGVTIKADGGSARYRAAGVGVYLGVGITKVTYSLLSLDIRIVYRAVGFSTRHWKIPVHPVAQRFFGGATRWGHMLCIEIGAGLIL